MAPKFAAPHADSVAVGAPRAQRRKRHSLKLLAILFILFILVVSETFTASVLAGFGEKAVLGRVPTPWGTLLQGGFLVAAYAAAGCLVERGVL